MPPPAKYHYLLAALAAEIVLVTAVRDQTALYFVGLSFILLSSFAAYLATRRRIDQIILLSLGLVAFALNATFHLFAFSVYLLVFDNLLWVGFTSYLGFLITRRIFTSDIVGRQEIYGALCVYLLLGVLFAQVNEILLYLDPSSIYFDPLKFKGQTRGTGDVLYYSFMTLTTVGYGDVSPNTPAARAVSLVECVTGIMYVAVLIARFVALYAAADRSARE